MMMLASSDKTTVYRSPITGHGRATDDERGLYNMKVPWSDWPKEAKEGLLWFFLCLGFIGMIICRVLHIVGIIP